MILQLRATPGLIPRSGIRQRHRLHCSASARGFTIIELVIVLVIIGVLSALVYPSFVDSIRKGRRTEAFGKLNAVQLAQERWRSNNATYASLLTDAPTATPPGLGIPATTGDGRYAISLEAGVTATTYAVIASAISGTSQAQDGSCVRLRVRIASGNIFYGSATVAGTFDESAGNRCWSR